MYHLDVKVLIVSPYLPPHVGGIERHTSELARAMSNRGAQVEIVTSSPLKNEVYEINLQIKIHTVSSYNILNRLPFALPSVKLFQLLKLLGKQNFDLVLLQSHLFPLAGIMGLYFRKKSKIVWINHGSGYVPSHISILKKFLKIYENIMITIVKNTSAYCISVSAEGSNWIKHMTGVSPKVIPNGAPFSAFKFPPQKDSEKIRILFVGRLLPNKGAAESIKIFDNALMRLSSSLISSSTTLEIIGDGPEFETVKQMAINSPNKIVIHGKKSHNDILQIMSQSHIFIYPSTYPEGLPTVILEASANAMAVVVYEGLPGMDVAAKRHAVEICAREKMEDHLIKLLTSPNEIYQLGQRALNYVTENHNWDKLSAQFLDLELK